MSKNYFALVRFMGKVVASVVVLIAIAGGIVSYLEIGDNNSANANMPSVKFSDFEEYKNSGKKELSDAELRALKDNFNEEFFNNFELIAKNISIYTDATKQVRANEGRLEEKLFMIVSKYDYPLRTAFLTQLLKETNNLVEYSEVMATDDTKAKIEWTDFMNWFIQDFKYQAHNNNVSETKYITIEASTFEKSAIAGIIIIVIMLSIMMSLLLRRDTKSNEVVVKTAPAKEPAKSATKAPAKRKPAAKKKETTKKDTTE